MPYYRFDNGLQPLSAPPEDWQGVLAVLEPSELHSAPLPSWLTPPAAPADPHESQFCWLRIDRDGVTGHLRTPVRASQSARHMGFTWTRDCLLLSDPDHAAADCIAHLTTQRTQPPGSPDAFVVALLIALIRDDLPYIQQLETRLTNLEQAVLDNETGRFLHQMSVIRKELNRANRFYAQLSDFASSLLEEAEDLFGSHSKKRLGHFLRKVESLQGETRLLVENTAGAGNTIARTAAEVGAILSLLPARLRRRSAPARRRSRAAAARTRARPRPAARARPARAGSGPPA